MANACDMVAWAALSADVIVTPAIDTADASVAVEAAAIPVLTDAAVVCVNAVPLLTKGK